MPGAAFGYIALGLAFIALSGRAQGYADPAIFVFLAILASLVVQGAVLLFRMLRRSASRRDGAVGASLAVMAACVYAGFLLDERAYSISQERGDAIIAQLRTYAAEQGSCPHGLSDLPLPPENAPAFSGSDWDYRAGDDGTCGLSFEGAAFIACSRTTVQADWICDD